MEKCRTRRSGSPEGQLNRQVIQGELAFEFEVHHFFLKGPDNKYFRVSEPTHKFSKVARYKINTWKSVVLLYTNNELSEREIKKIIALTNASKKNKILRNEFKQGWEIAVYWKWQDRVRHLSLFERAPAAYVSGANFLSWRLIGLPRKPSYSVSFLHRIFLLSSPHTIILDISD